MTPFEYLSVLVSIIIGLGLSHLLSSTARLIQLRHRVRMHLPTLLWMLLLFVLQIQIWWAAFEGRHEAEWNFFSFLFFLLIPVLAYLLSYLLVPDLEDEADIDLRASYHANRVWFFGIFALAALVSLGRDFVEDGREALDLDAAFRIAFLVMSLASARIRGEAFHRAGAAATLMLFCAYVFVLFLQLS